MAFDVQHRLDQSGVHQRVAELRHVDELIDVCTPASAARPGARAAPAASRDRSSQNTQQPAGLEHARELAKHRVGPIAPLQHQVAEHELDAAIWPAAARRRRAHTRSKRRRGHAGARRAPCSMPGAMSRAITRAARIAPLQRERSPGRCRRRGRGCTCGSSAKYCEPLEQLGAHLLLQARGRVVAVAGAVEGARQRRGGRASSAAGDGRSSARPLRQAAAGCRLAAGMRARTRRERLPAGATGTARAPARSSSRNRARGSAAASAARRGRRRHAVILAGDHQRRHVDAPRELAQVIVREQRQPRAQRLRLRQSPCCCSELCSVAQHRGGIGAAAHLQLDRNRRSSPRASRLEPRRRTAAASRPDQAVRPVRRAHEARRARDQHQRGARASARLRRELQRELPAERPAEQRARRAAAASRQRVRAALRRAALRAATGCGRARQVDRGHRDSCSPSAARSPSNTRRFMPQPCSSTSGCGRCAARARVPLRLAVERARPCARCAPSTARRQGLGQRVHVLRRDARPRA